ncbi:MAG TPA: uroporphyrinogen-III synthase [Steroidobacteraceae bacterium]|jgi:uroporphyrinogen-III synthase|nr:uroporphyrinogen-III synthase [Steroidobacteraceae bacterium]
MAEGALTNTELPPVVVTRAEPADGPLSSELKSRGLRVILWPAIEVTRSDTTDLVDALGRIADFDWIVFASRNAVTPVLERIAMKPPSLKVAAVGKATAQVLRQRGWDVDIVPDEANAGALVEAFAKVGMDGMRVLYPASSRALPMIAKGLAQLGATVTQVEAYRTEAAATLDVDACRAQIDRNEIGAVTFASPSAVIELERALGHEHFEKLFATAAAVAIGPTTARVLTELGRTPVLAESATLRGLADATYRFLQTRH